MMHAACMSMEGFIMLSSGDEIGQVNDYNYKKPGYCSRQQISASQSIPVGQCRKEKKAGTVQYDIWNGLKQMEEIRRRENCFGETAGISTWGTGNDAVLQSEEQKEMKS